MNSVQTDVTNSHSIFTKEEIKTFVKNVLLSLDKGLKIKFPLRDEILQIERWAGNNISPSEAKKREVTGKNSFLDLVMICSDDKNANSQQVEQATYMLFRRIMGLYLGGRIEGKVSEVNLEQRLSQVEKNVYNLSKIVMDLKDLHKKGTIK
jgi:hypothetical protein